MSPRYSTLSVSTIDSNNILLAHLLQRTDISDDDDDAGSVCPGLAGGRRQKKHMGASWDVSSLFFRHVRLSTELGSVTSQLAKRARMRARL